MEVGSYIKLQRVKQGMTQEELASGIVSMSYLSKIENQRTDASPEVINLLCTRLGIEIDNEKDVTIKEKCEQWYNMLFEVNDRDEIVSGYNQLKQWMDTVSSNNFMMFEIHKVRYYLVLGKFSEALQQINYLTEISNTFDNLHQYYWYKFKGNYNSTNGDFNQAMKWYESAEDKLKQLDLPEREEADLYYIMAVTHSKIHNTLEAIDFAEQAIDIFQKEYHFLRCAQCHVVLGISFRRLQMYDKAIKNYNLAKHLAKLERNKQLIQLTNMNLGYLYSTKGDSRSSIQYYCEIIDDENVDVIIRLTSITSLIKLYYAIGDIEKTKEMIDIGFALFEDNQTITTNTAIRYTATETVKTNYYLLTTYKYAVHHEHHKFENLVIHEFIPFLKKHKEHTNLVDISKMLAEHFEKQNKYKQAVKYYKLVNLTYNQLMSI
ncbi:MAG TPA: helix-turn-helix domain-containing protein [Bacillota bacterium]